MGKSGELKLKHICNRCQVNKWCVDFKEGRHADITSRSICLTCELRELVEKGRKEILELRRAQQDQDRLVKKLENEIVDLRKQVEDRDQIVPEKTPKCNENITMRMNIMENAIKEIGDSSTETGIGLVEIRKEIAALKTCTPANSPVGREKVSGPDSFTLVKGKKAARPRKSRKSSTISTSNRFAPLLDEVTETYLIGDSMVAGQGSYFAMGSKGKRKIRSFPGAGAKKIHETLEKVKLENRKTTVIVHGGGNDLFLREGKVGQTETIVKEAERIIKTINRKTDCGIFVGLVPRLKVSRYALSKAIGINNRVESVCQRNGVRFVNPWDTFISHREYFRKDGIHFSDIGKKVYADLLNRSLYTHIRPPDGAVGMTVSQPGAASLLESPNPNIQGNGKGLGGSKTH